ncbi:MAG: hypothetical protein EA376_00130 [Phycisphaeraceae bacterium]|nr:MAG: hypothetical protein EA376_00130 [Phycisphaeraceae bacterium]
MAFARDRDLIVFEPTLFRDVAWAGQRLVVGDGVSISGTTLSAPGDNFEAAGVEAGHVALVDELPLEVVDRLSATELMVSRLRDRLDAPPVAPGAMSDAKLVIASFRPQIESMHELLMRSAGLAPSDPMVVNERDVARVEALGALHTILSAAAPATQEGTPMWDKARLYADRFRAERGRLVIEIDLDDDGEADALRRIGAARFRRA